MFYTESINNLGRSDLGFLIKGLFNNYVTHREWVSGFFVMLRDRKQGGGSEGYLMKGRNVTIKKS